MSDRLTPLLDTYEESHRHPTNLLIHKVCVPLITFHILGMLHWVKLWASPWGALSLAHVAGLGVLGWYLSLNLRYAAIMAVFGGLCIVLAGLTPWWGIVAVAVGAWVVQLIGHSRYERRSPAFASNLLQLLVGPLFVIAVLLGERRVGAWVTPSP